MTNQGREAIGLLAHQECKQRVPQLNTGTDRERCQCGFRQSAHLLVVDVEVDVEEVPEPEERPQLQRLDEPSPGFLSGPLSRRHLPGRRHVPVGPASPVLLLLQRRGRHEAGAGGEAEAVGREEERRLGAGAAVARAGAAAWARVGGERPRGAWPDEPDGSRALHGPPESWCSGRCGRRGSLRRRRARGFHRLGALAAACVRLTVRESCCEEGL